MYKEYYSAKIIEKKHKVWKGFYGRIMGSNESVFHVKYIGGQFVPVIIKIYEKEYEYQYFVIGKEALDLANLVNKAKTYLSGQKGGSFLINEFGQIIVPSALELDNRKLYVGDVEGVLHFKDAEDGKIFNLSDTDNLKSGDVWKYPYVGSRFNIKKNGEIYRKNDDEDESEYIKCPHQDAELIKRIMKIRGKNGARLIVTPNGVVLTKKEREYGTWIPVYVGKIDYKKWFKKEN